MKNKNRINLKWRPRKCVECGGKLVEMESEYTNGVTYKHWHCNNCGDEIVDMTQLHEVAMAERKMRKAQAAKVSKWGSALAIRIPKEIVVEQKIKAGEKFRFLKEKNGFRLIPEKD